METDKIKKSIIVTGATGSMGSAAVRSLATEGYTVIMACRNMDKADQVYENIMRDVPSAQLYPLYLDLSLMDSVHSFADSVLNLSGVKDLSITGLLNNAGVINRHFQKTPDGLENTLVTNFLGPFLLTALLLPHLPDDAHIVNMVSLTCRFASIHRDFFYTQPSKYSQLGTYADTKLALLVSSIILNEKLRQRGSSISVNVADPGVVNSNMLHMGRWFDPIADALFRPFCNTPETGIRPALNALHSDQTGMYYLKDNYKPIPDRYNSYDHKNWLWHEAERLTGLS